ncbi:MAG: AI-2E family transporter [Chloroflexota bacterium]
MAASLEVRKAHAAARWRLLADRLRTITPETVARTVIGVAVLAVCGWLAAASWPALLPFVAGLIIAYAVLPIANRLDRFMPRVLAAVIAELVALAVLVGVGVLVVPPLVRSLVIVGGLLPTPDRVNAGLDNLQQVIGQLQEPVRSIVLSVTTQVASNLQGALDGIVNGAATFVTRQILGLAGTVSFVLGLLVIPAWILTLVADDREIRRRGARIIAPGLRADVLALARIADRAFATFLRVRVVLSIAAGLLIWLGLEAARNLGLGQFSYAVAGATLLGILQLIPELGFFLGFFPILLVLIVQGPAEALVVVAVYWGATRLAGLLVEDRVSGGVLDVHPALLIPGIVVLSQFGLLWTLAAAPLIAIGRDVVRYLAGRLAEPAQPAGLLPGERRARRAAAPVSVPVPSAYRAAAQRGVGALPAPAAAPDAAKLASGPALRPALVPAPSLPEPAFTPSFSTADFALPPVTERSIAS